MQRCPSRQKNCRCRTATFEKKATAPLPHRYRSDLFKNLPLPRRHGHL
jgi:hypothetical protein